MQSVRVAFRWQPPPAAAGTVPPPLAVKLARDGATVAEWAGEVLWDLPGGGNGREGTASGGWVTTDVTLPQCEARAKDVLQVRAMRGELLHSFPSSRHHLGKGFRRRYFEVEYMLCCTRPRCQTSRMRKERWMRCMDA